MINTEVDIFEIDPTDQTAKTEEICAFEDYQITDRPLVKKDDGFMADLMIGSPGTKLMNETL